MASHRHYSSEYEKHRYGSFLKPACSLVIVLVIALNHGCSRDNNRGPETNLEKSHDCNSMDLERTVVVSTLSTPMPPNKNVIWCSSFQIAWNELMDNIIKAPIEITGGEEFSKHLNAARQSHLDLPPESCYAGSGFVKDGIAEEIQAEMARRFPSVPTPQFGELTPIDILAYSYMAANVKFKIPFFENREDFAFKDSLGNETPVTSFGIRSQDEYAYHKLREQVQILLCQDDPNTDGVTGFAIDLCKYTKPNQVVIAQIPRKDTLAQMLGDLEERIAEFPKEERAQRFGVNDVLLVPNMYWRLAHRFREIEKKHLANPGYETYWVKEASQVIQFRLDRSGAELKSEAKVVAAPVPRHFVLDGSFLIYLKKRGAEYPFFVMWVDNAELLSKPKPSSQ
jgi:hypothetical protein